MSDTHPIDDASAPAIEVHGLTKRFGGFVAVDGIDLTVPRGRIFGFLGPNGSGKTTTIRMLTGTIAPSAGSARVLGADVVSDPETVRRSIGYMSQKFSLFEDLTVDENLRFYAGVYGISGERFEQRRRYVLEMADLIGRERELTVNLSVGWKQRLALGCATIHEPRLLFLDEPTSGVDPLARRRFWDLIYDLAEDGVTLFVTTHYMDEASHCGQLAFIYDGRIIAEGSPRSIRDGLEHEHILELEVDDTDRAVRVLDDSPELPAAYLAGARLRVELPQGVAPERIRALLTDAGLAIHHLATVEPTIEDVFVSIVAAQRKGSEPS